MQGLILDANEFKDQAGKWSGRASSRNETILKGTGQALFAQNFMSHLYHWPVIGWFPTSMP